MTPLLACERSIFSKNYDYNKLFEALKLIRIKYTVLTQNRSCLRISKHVTESI